MNNVVKSTNSLKSLRLKSGKTQRQVSLELNIKTQTLSDWERGLKQPRLSIFQTLRLCELYDCSLSDLAASLIETAKLTKCGTNTDIDSEILIAS
jgi:transcriptional regulator with XRE-family HTH domain